MVLPVNYPTGLPMEQSVSKCSSCDVDLESGMTVLNSNASDEQSTAGLNSFCGIGSCNGSMLSEARVTVAIASNYSDISLGDAKLIVDKQTVGQKNTDGSEKKSLKEKPKAKAMSAKKPPKPPRAPRGLSLDSTDQKLIKELAEIARLKRARIERMKAVMKMKEARNSSLKNQLFVTLLTVLFFLVVLFQGISSRNHSHGTFQGSPIATRATGGGIFSILQSQSLLANNV